MVPDDLGTSISFTANVQGQPGIRTEVISEMSDNHPVEFSAESGGTITFKPEVARDIKADYTYNLRYYPDTINF